MNNHQDGSVAVATKAKRKSPDGIRKKPHPRSEQTATCIELFAGAGGLLLGLEMAGFRTIVANEIHAHPCLTLSHNFPSIPVLNASLRDLSGRELIAHANTTGPIEVDLIAGGPPCQGFSTAGLKEVADPRNTLIGDFIRIVREVRPRFFLLENVTGLQTLHEGKLFANVLHELSLLGYSFHHRILMAAHYGVPQMRKRLIVIGSREGKLPEHPEPTHRDPATSSLFERSLPTYTTCQDALGDLPLIMPGEIATEYTMPPTTAFQKRMREGSKKLHNHQASNHRQKIMDYYALVPPGGTALDIPIDVRNGKQGVQRWPVDGLSRTITTEPTDFLHPTLNRIPTVRELARIQTFPDRYKFLGQRTTGNKMRRLGYCSQTQQVGNAVPPLLAEAIGRSILAHCR